jgi:FtsZ-binding cell division protein ZapB
LKQQLAILNLRISDLETTAKTVTLLAMLLEKENQALKEENQQLKQPQKNASIT